MPRIATPGRLDSLKDLTRLIQEAEGFHPLVAALKNGHGATVDGAWGSSCALTAAALGLHAPSTLLIVVAHPRDLDGWIEDVAGFAGIRPVVFPAWDSMPSGAAGPDEVSGQRLRLLKTIETGDLPRFVLTTMQALIQ